MGSKKNQTKQVPSLSHQRTAGPPWVLIGGIVGVVAFAFLALYPTVASESGAAVGEVSAVSPTPELEEAKVAELTPSAGPVAAENSQAASPKPPPNAPLPPLPPVPSIAPRPANVIAEAYTFAARNPDVLEFVPCFCGCERAGHRGNADCFVQSRNVDGSVKDWETHGMGCAVCIDVARDSAQLRRSGASVRDVRAAIEAKYESRFPRKTPTPQPQ